MGVYRNFAMIAALPETETIVVRKKAIVIPTMFQMPENTPAKVFRHINGVWPIRYFCIPEAGDTLEFRGHLWVVINRHYGKVNVKGSPNGDAMPIVFTKYMGEMDAKTVPFQ